MELTIKARGRFWCGDVSFHVPELIEEAFEPLKTCDDPVIAYASGEELAGSVEAQRVLKFRGDAAEYIHEVLINHLLKGMGQHDTHNGYKKGE